MPEYFIPIFASLRFASPRSHLDPAEYPRALEVQHPLEGVGVEVPGPGAQVVEAPDDGVRDEERVVLEEEVLVVLHSVRAEDADVAAGDRPQKVRLFFSALFLFMWSK